MKIFLKLFITLSFLPVYLLAQETKVNGFLKLKGEYLGQKKPGMIPEVFAPGIVSAEAYVHGAPAFTRDGSEVYWAVIFDDPSTGMILSMKRVQDEWSEIQPLPFCEARFRNVSPVLSADGKRLFFQSCRPVKMMGKTPEYNIWFTERMEDGWIEPQLLDSCISSGKDGRPIVLKDETIYFCSWREGTSNYIYRSEYVNGHYRKPEKVEADFNEDAIPTWVNDDETCIIFESSRPGGFGESDFWISFRKKGKPWGNAINLGAKVNSSSSENFGSFSSDFKYFFFGSDRNGNGDIYWVDAKVIEELRLKDLK